jgi:hypothetical protein
MNSNDSGTSGEGRKSFSALRITFIAEDVSGVVRLLWDEAPRTCRAVADLIPIEGEAHQAIYSGSESVLVLPRLIRVEAENASSQVTTGDVGFAWFAAGSAYGVVRDFAEICWFYDRDAQPRMWEGPVAVSIFGRVDQPADDFFEMSRRMRREGVKAVRVEAVGV